MLNFSFFPAKTEYALFAPAAMEAKVCEVAPLYGQRLWR